MYSTALEYTNVGIGVRWRYTGHHGKGQIIGRAASDLANGAATGRIPGGKPYSGSRWP